MTRTVWPEQDVIAVKPDYVAPLVAALCSDRPPAAGQLYEAAGGWFAATRWQRARGVDFEHAEGVPSVEQVAKVSNIVSEAGFNRLLIQVQAFAEICNFDNGHADNPDTPQEGSKWTMGNAMKNPTIVSFIGPMLWLCVNCKIRLSACHKKTGPTENIYQRFRPLSP